MIKAVTRLIIASAGLWLALPAAAQFEIDPDHFGDPVPTVVQPRPEQPKGSMRTSLSHKQAQGGRVQAFKGTKSPANTPQKLSSAADVKHHSVSRTSRVGQRPADRKRSEQSRLAPSHRVLEGVAQ
jgi:hypothetical protein